MPNIACDDIHSQCFPVKLSWKNINYRVNSKKILRTLSGCALPGRTLAIMGSSGAGKTTLLNALSDRLDNNGRHKVLSGQITLNDVKYSHKFRRLLGFVPQDDIIGAMATPRSAFHFALRTRRGVPLDRCDEIVNKMIEELRLSACSNTRVGAPGLSQGLSGGERKRTNIGLELISDTKVLLLDEPTSGLDSNTGEKVLALLREIAQKGRTVVYTVHQPTADMIQHMDDLLLLTHGEVVYHGPMREAERYFGTIGYPCPETWTPTDHYMALIQEENNTPRLVACWKAYLKEHNIINDEENDTLEITLREGTEDKKENDTEMNEPVHLGPNTVPTDIASALSEVPSCLYPMDAKPHVSVDNNITQNFLTEYMKATGSSFSVQFYELTIRSFTFLWKNLMFLGVSLIQTLVFSVLISLIFANIKDTTTGVQDRVGLLFLLILNKGFAWSNMTLHNFKPERAVFLREQQSGAYSPTLYFFTKWLAELPHCMLNIAVESVIVYFAAGLHLDPKNFFTFYAAMLFCAQTASSLGILIGIAINNDSASAGILPMIMLPMMLSAGMLASTDQIRPYWIWLEKISFLRHTFVITTENEFMSLNDITCEASKYGADLCLRYPKTGPDVFSRIVKLDDDQDRPWIMWTSMALLFIVLRLIGLFAIHVVARSKF